jgi:hypothetical protein
MQWPCAPAAPMQSTCPRHAFSVPSFDCVRQYAPRSAPANGAGDPFCAHVMNTDLGQMNSETPSTTARCQNPDTSRGTVGRASHSMQTQREVTVEGIGSHTSGDPTVLLADSELPTRGCAQDGGPGGRRVPWWRSAGSRPRGSRGFRGVRETLGVDREPGPFAWRSTGSCGRPRARVASCARRVLERVAGRGASQPSSSSASRAVTAVTASVPCHWSLIDTSQSGCACVNAAVTSSRRSLTANGESTAMVIVPSTRRARR